MRLFKLDISHRSAITLALVIALPWLIYLSRPYPMTTLYLAVGQAGSSYQTLGKKLTAYFESHGLKLELVQTSGMQDGLVKLDDDRVAINAAFMTAGQPMPKAWTGLASLGSVQYAPLWLIYRGDGPRSDRDIFDMRIAVGAEGTNTLALFKVLAEANGYADLPANLVKLSHKNAVAKLQSGELDGVFIVDGFDSGNVQDLLHTPGNQIYSFQMTDAYTWQTPYLNKLNMPRGALSISPPNPDTDKTLLSTSVALMVEEETHPYIQWMLIKAIHDISNEGTRDFTPLNFFPAQLDSTSPLSDVAKRYYQSGFPELTQYLPWWLAIYLDRIWIFLLTILAVIVPIRELWSAITDLRTKETRI